MNMYRRTIQRFTEVVAILVLALSLALVQFSCAQGAEEANPEVKIGSILDLTGLGASYGERMEQAFELALEDGQNAGGIIEGWNATLLTEDFQWDTGKALTAYRKLVGVNGVKVIVGITGSRNAKPVAEASKRDDVIIVDALTSSPTLTRQGGPHYFRVMASDAFAGKFNAQWASESGMKRAGIVYAEDEWGVSYRDELKGYLGDIAESEVYEAGASVGARDYRPQISRLKRFGADAIFLLLYPPDAGLFAQQARQDGLTATIYGSDNLSSPEFTEPGNEVVEGVRVALPAAVEGPAYSAFRERYSQRYGEEADTLAAKSYDAMAVALDGINRVGNDPAALRKLFTSPDYSFEGLTGTIEFDENGDLKTQAYTRMIYSDGALVPFDGASNVDRSGEL